jgi:FkbM family methyltransferase
MSDLREFLLNLYPFCRSRIGRLINHRYKVTRNGYTINIPVIHGIGRCHLDDHEPHIATILRRLHGIGALDLLIDFGANVGQTLIKHAIITNGSARYIGFEPNPSAVSYLGELVDANGWNRAILIPMAAGEDFGISKIFLGARNRPDPGASINTKIRDSSFYSAESYIGICNGDQVLAQLSITESRFTVKVDTEGSELEVLTGISQLLRISRPYLIVEILPPSSGFSDEVNQYRLRRREEVVSYMRGMNYLVSYISRDGSLVSAESIDYKLTQVTDDYLFIPIEFSNVLFATN